MATLYALSSLSSWGNPVTAATGWSLTSGGSEYGWAPDTTDDVIFDSNSGSARSISLDSGASCNSINAVAGSAAFTFPPGGTLNIYGIGVTSDFSRFNAVNPSVQIHSGGDHTLKPCPLQDLVVNSAGTHVTLSGNLSVSSLQINSDTILTVGTYSVTSQIVSMSGTVNMGSNTWTITASASSSGGITAFNAGGIINAQTSTLKFTGSAALGPIYFYSNNKTFNVIQNSTTGAYNGIAGLTIWNAGLTASNLVLDPSSSFTVQAGQTVTVANLSANGALGQIQIRSESVGTRFNLTKTGGGTVNVDYCYIKDVDANPASTWRARTSTNGGNNLDWEFIGPNSNMSVFL